MKSPTVYSARSAEIKPARQPFSNSILATLAYFDIFNYPLRKDEIKQFLDCVISEHEMQLQLDLLVKNAAVFLLPRFIYVTGQSPAGPPQVAGKYSC